ncbi:hypothetical protein BU15DRAFT_75298 [Melanogaster broomeanus]|nr:hypothetical protein BU15DRAFT_75298 [Melanogaster broomeanus]
MSLFPVLHERFLLAGTANPSGLPSRSSLETCLPQVLRHYLYIRCLPAAEKLLAPLQFSKEALEVLKGTSLYGATLDPEREWCVEWEKCFPIVQNVNQAWGEAFMWFVHALRYYETTYSRSNQGNTSGCCNPSLVTRVPVLYPLVEPSLVSTLSTHPTHPVLIPGIVSCSEATEGETLSGTVSIVAHPNTSSEETSDDQFEEVFNNYGLKANDELILGYGFSLPRNPEDKMALQRKRI